jgi:hypothetical protein
MHTQIQQGRAGQVWIVEPRWIGEEGVVVVVAAVVDQFGGAVVEGREAQTSFVSQSPRG